MRLLLVFAPLLVAAPAVAQERDPAEIARVLGDPAVQEGATAAIAGLADILLDTRVGALAALGDANVRPDDTLRDVKRRDDPDFERKLRRDTRRTLARAGAVAGGVAAGTAELQRAAGRLAAALAPLLRAGDADRTDR